MPKATLASPANWKGYPALWNRRQAVRVTRQTSQPIARGSGLRTNEVRTGSAEGGLKIFRYRICDDPSGAGFGGIATLFLEDKDRRRQYCLRQSGDADRATSIRRSYVSSISGSTSVATSRAGCPNFLRVGHVSVIAQSTIVGRIAFGGLGTVPFARTLLPDGALRRPHHSAHQQPSSPVSVEQLQQTDWSDAMTAPPELRQQIWHPAPAARRSGKN